LDTISVNASRKLDADPQVIATVEIDDSYESLYELRRIAPSYAVLHEHPNHVPARGVLWVDVLLAGVCEGRDWMADAADVIAVLEISSRALPTYRLIRGDQWLHRAVAADRDGLYVRRRTREGADGERSPTTVVRHHQNRYRRCAGSAQDNFAAAPSI